MRVRPLRAGSWIVPIVGVAVALILVGCSSSAGAAAEAAERSKVRAYVTSALDFMGEHGLHVKKDSWARIRDQVLAGTRYDTTYQQTYGALMLAAWTAGDPRHSAFRSPAAFKALVTAYGDGRTQPSAQMVASNVAEIALPQFWGGTPVQAQNYADVGANLIHGLTPAATCGWVVDLRKDYGGNMMPMLTSVSALLPEGGLVSFVDRDKKSTWIRLTASTVAYEADSVSQRDTLTARTGGSSLAGRPVAVLQGKDTGSSGEATLLAFHDQPGVRTFGQTSAGLATANLGKTMPDGANLLITTSLMTDRHGHTFPTGIPPEEPIAIPTHSDTAEDPTMVAAINWLQQTCGN